MNIIDKAIQALVEWVCKPYALLLQYTADQFNAQYKAYMDTQTEMMKQPRGPEFTMLCLLEVRTWEDMEHSSFHVKEVWSDGSKPEYVYPLATILDTPNLLPNLKAYYERMLSESPREHTHVKADPVDLLGHSTT